MKREIMAGILSVAMGAAALAGCGGSSQEAKSGGTSEAGSLAEAENSLAAAPSAAEESAPGGEAPSSSVSEASSASDTADIPYGHFTAEGAAEQEVRLAFLTFQTNPFFLQVKEGYDAVAEYLKQYNCTVDYINMGEELTTDYVVSGMENAITMDYDGIAVIPVFDGTEEVINKAVDSDIPVITFVAEGTEGGKRFCNVGQDAYSAGQTAGEEIARFCGGEGQVAVITGTFGAVQHENRMAGALDYLADHYPDIEIVGKVENNDSASTAYSQTMDFLTANPDLKAVYVTAGGTYGAAQAIQEKGLTGQVGVVGYDHTPENMEYVYSGEIIAAVSQDPQGQAWDASVMLFNHVVFGTEYDEHFATDNIVVTPETAVEMYGENK